VTDSSAPLVKRNPLDQWARHPVHSLDKWWETKFSALRLDHNISNFCVILGLIITALSTLILGSTPTSSLNVAPRSTEMAMCACIFIGLSIKMHGVLAHSRWYFPNTTLRRCYQFGYTGAPIASAGLFVYGFYLIEHTELWSSVIGACVTPFLGVGVLLQGGMYWLEARRMERAEREMIRIAKQFKDIP
jgi:hypothetical protein